MNGTERGDHDEWSDAALPIRTRHNAYPLPGFVHRQVNRTSLVVREPLANTLTSLLQSHGTLYAWAQGHPQPRALRGRAPVYVADVPETDVTLVVRHAWHGGMFAPFTRDLYLRPTRAPIELIRTIMLRGVGIAVPELLAYALYPAGPALYRVDVATRFVPNAHDLGAVLADHAPGISRADAMLAVQQLLVMLAEHGMVHPDLNVKNILLERGGAQTGAVKAHMIDVDVVRWLPRQRPSVTMLANVARLARSMRKWRTQFGITLADAELNDLVARFLAATPTQPIAHAAASVRVSQPSPTSTE